jgi:hypothetical protein
MSTLPFLAVKPVNSYEVWPDKSFFGRREGSECLAGNSTRLHHPLVKVKRNINKPFNISSESTGNPLRFCLKTGVSQR